MRGVSNRLQLRPAIGFVAALPFIMPTPVVAGSFLQTLGSSGVEPLLYVLILWMLQSRPFAFGALLVFGYLHREFTLYAVPALVVIHAADRSIVECRGRAVDGTDGGRVRARVAHPRRSQVPSRGSPLFLQAQMFARWPCLETMGPIERIRYLLTMCLPVLFGGTRISLTSTGCAVQR